MGNERRAYWTVAATVIVVASATIVRAQESTQTNTGGASGTPSLQEPLRWKFKLGEKLKYHVVEDMTLTTRGGPLEDTKTPLHQEMDVTWTVVGVKDDGEAVIEQKFSNVKLTMIGPRGEKIEYDSAGDDDRASLAAMVAPIYDALAKGEFEFTITARGEVRDVKVAEEVLEALKSNPGAALLGDVANAEGLQRMLVKWALVLPEKAPEVGEVWRSRVELQMPTGGEQIVESSYSYEGTKEIDGWMFAVFRPGLEVTFTGNDKATKKVKEQQSSGEILFDVAAGRLQSAVFKRDLILNVAVAGQTVEQSVKQTVTVSLTPAK